MMLITPHATVAHNPVSSLVYSAKDADVHVVPVNGRIVIQDGRIPGFTDGERILQEATKRGRDISEKAGFSERAPPWWPGDPSASG